MFEKVFTHYVATDLYSNRDFADETDQLKYKGKYRR